MAAQCNSCCNDTKESDMIRRNENFKNLAKGYLFPEIAKRRREFQASHPEAKIISLGIGNTTEPLAPHIVEAMKNYVEALGTTEGYEGYQDDSAGNPKLRSRIADVVYSGRITADEVFVSDGAKCDLGRLQFMFGSGVRVAVQDPSYPVYVDGSVMAGAAGREAATPSGFPDITYMPCLPENGFFPDLSAVKPDSLIYICSPNNPTGAVATRNNLSQLVRFAKGAGCIVLFDAAYSSFIRDSALPKSIYEIEGATECAIEMQSLSKPAGFTGVRLGWCVVPQQLTFADGSKVADTWARLTNTAFNGASNIAQVGALAALDDVGLRQTQQTIDYYLENASLIRQALEGANFSVLVVKVYSGGNAPYVWAAFPDRKSWDVFDTILSQCHVVTTPGAGFGPSGESFIRFSAFGHRESVKEACDRLSHLKL